MLKLKLRKKKNKDITNQWTYKVGRKIGTQLDKLFINKKFTVAFIAALLLILFIFIVPIQNNIITVSLLVVLLIIHFILKRKK